MSPARSRPPALLPDRAQEQRVGGVRFLGCENPKESRLVCVVRQNLEVGRLVVKGWWDGLVRGGGRLVTPRKDNKRSLALKKDGGQRDRMMLTRGGESADGGTQKRAEWVRFGDPWRVKKKGGGGIGSGPGAGAGRGGGGARPGGRGNEGCAPTRHPRPPSPPLSPVALLLGPQALDVLGRQLALRQRHGHRRAPAPAAPARGPARAAARAAAKVVVRPAAARALLLARAAARGALVAGAVGVLCR